MLQSIVEYWHIFSSLVGLAALGIVFYLRKSYVTHAKCKECRKELEDRCVEIEDLQRDYAEGRAGMIQQLDAMPKVEDLHELRLAIERLSGDIRTMQAEIKGQSDMLKVVKSQGDRMNSFLLENH